GTKAAEKAPSANSRRKKLGSLNATMKASATAPEPSRAVNTMSRMKPVMRLSSVKLPTVATARPRLMAPIPYALPHSCHSAMAYSLSVAAAGVVAGLNRYHGRSRGGAGFLLSPRQLQQGLAILGCELLVVGDDAVELVGRQHALQAGEALRRPLLDDVEH